jgi:hypothetical protein
MPRYRERVVEVEAWQFNGDVTDAPMWMHTAIRLKAIRVSREKLYYRGHAVTKTCWFLRDVISGEITAMTNSTFKNKYQATEGANDA